MLCSDHIPAGYTAGSGFTQQDHVLGWVDCCCNPPRQLTFSQTHISFDLKSFFNACFVGFFFFLSQDCRTKGSLSIFDALNIDICGFYFTLVVRQSPK